MDPASTQGVVLQMQGGPPPANMQGAPANMQGLPAGLQYLAALDEINIHQHLDIVEVAIGFEKNNKYKICNSQDQQFMYAKEDTDCCTRQCCGRARPFDMNITDNNLQPLISLYRPFRCQASFMWCCFLQEMEIMSPPGVSIGSIKQLWTPWTPKFHVFDAQQNPVFQIDGVCCFCCPCTDITFKVTELQKSMEIGEITKHWGGCREIFGGVNDFKVTFPADLDVMSKALLLSATFLIDFNYFEKSNN